MSHNLTTSGLLHTAVSEGDVLKVLRLLTQGANPNVEDAVFGEPPLFEAAVADASSVVVLLLLFRADARMCGRHSSAGAVQFALEGSVVAELLDIATHGSCARNVNDINDLFDVGQVWKNLVGKAIAPVIDAVVLGSPEARILDWHLKSNGHPGLLWRARLSRPASVQLHSVENAQTWLCSPPMDIAEAADQVLRRECTNKLMESLHGRLVEQRPGSPSPHDPRTLFSPNSATARVAWAIVALHVPREALAMLPAASGALAELLLDVLDDNAWRHATSRVSDEIVTRDSRRKGLDGYSLRWRYTFQEAVTQQLFCWGVDGTVTGFGARAPQKSYSRPRVLPLESLADRISPEGLQPAVRAIACGRRHNAVLTFGEAVYVWGRDVVPPATTQDNTAIVAAMAGLARNGQRGRLRGTARDRPTLLAQDFNPVQPSFPAVHSISERDVSDSMLDPASISEGMSATLLQLVGGWTVPDVPQLDSSFGFQGNLEDVAPQLPADLPPLRKVVHGGSFIVALSHDGRCFAWRRPGFALAGTMNEVSEEPRSMLPTEEIAVDIAAGDLHAVILTERGRVWTFGWRPVAALGRGPWLGMEPAVGLAAPIPELERVVQVNAGATFTLCVDCGGSLWLFGEGPCIIGCFGDPRAIFVPRCVQPQVFGGRRVLSAACGEGHVLVLTAWDPSRLLPQPGAWFATRTDQRSTSEEFVRRT